MGKSRKLRLLKIEIEFFGGRLGKNLNATLVSFFLRFLKPERKIGQLVAFEIKGDEKIEMGIRLSLEVTTIGQCFKTFFGRNLDFP